MAKKIIFLLVLVNVFKQHKCLITTKYIKCTSVDRNFSRFDLCELQKTKDGNDGMSFIIRLLQVPVTNCQFQMEVGMIMPNKFAFNTTWDVCEFMKHRKKFRPLIIFYELFSRYTNLNHSCPYNHDIIAKHMDLNQIDSRLPWPAGEYNVKTSWIMDGIVRISVNFGTVIRKK